MGSSEFPSNGYDIQPENFLPTGLTLSFSNDLAPNPLNGISTSLVGYATAVEVSTGPFTDIGSGSGEFSPLVRQDDGIIRTQINAADLGSGGSGTIEALVSLTTRQLPIQGWEV